MPRWLDPERTDTLFDVGAQIVEKRTRLQEKKVHRDRLLPWNRVNEVGCEILRLIGMSGNQADYVARFIQLVNETLKLPMQAVMDGKYPFEEAVKWVMEDDPEPFLTRVEALKSDFK